MKALHLAGLAAAAPLLAGGLLPSTAAAVPKPIKFTAIEDSSSQKGKTISFQEHLVSAAGRIGHDTIACTQAKSVVDCAGTFYLTAGALKVKITVVGTAKVDHGTVTGGTGTYAGKTGTLTLTHISTTKTTIVITLS